MSEQDMVTKMKCEAAVISSMCDYIRTTQGMTLSNDEIGLALPNVQQDVQKLLYYAIEVVIQFGTAVNVLMQENEALRKSMDILAEMNNAN